MLTEKKTHLVKYTKLNSWIVSNNDTVIKYNFGIKFTVTPFLVPGIFIDYRICKN